MDEGGPNICHVLSGTVGDEQANTNALLIAAAPNLLAALTTTYDQIAALEHVYQFTAGDDQVNHEVLAKARAAITKATGAPPDQIGPAAISTEEFLARR